MITAALGLLIVVFGALWLDAYRFHGKVLRNVSIAGHDVGGMNPASLDRFIDDLESDYQRQRVRVAVPGGGFSAPGSAFGLVLDRPMLRRAALRAGRGSGVGGVFKVLGSALGHRKVLVPVHVDPAAIARALRGFEGSQRVEPIDPQLQSSADGFTVRPGRAGRGVDPVVLARSIPAQAANGLPITVGANRVDLPSKFSAAELQQLVRVANRETKTPVPVALGDRIETVTSSQLRAWVVPSIQDRKVVLTLDPDMTMRGVRRLFAGIGQSTRDARLTIASDGSVHAIASQVGESCCNPSAVDQLQAALSRPSTQPLLLQMISVQPNVTTEKALALGVHTVIGAFTTRHACCENRVQNIHRLADIIRGRLILPGETLSINAIVGERTEAKGFVNAPSIKDGVHEDSIGGGISQFATTLFNASFFGGLDLVDYQSHSQYIKRYPFGREATLGFPRPDLKIRNSTPFGVMIWPVYTKTSITISLYSTPYSPGAVERQEVEDRGQCKLVTTFRVRRFPDGSTKEDKVKAGYRPGEGLNCAGDPTPGATTTTLKTRPTVPPSDRRPTESTLGSALRIGPGSSPETTKGQSTTETTKAQAHTEQTEAASTTPSEPASSKANEPAATRHTRPKATEPKVIEPPATKPAEPVATKPPDAPPPFQQPVVQTTVGP